MLSAVIFLFSSCREKEEPVDVCSRLQEVQRLELSRMTVGKVGMISDPTLSDARTFQEKTAAVVDAMKVGKRIGVYSYDTYLIAYIDLSKLRPEDVAVDPENHTARVKLPPVEIVTDGREPQLHEEHYRVTGLRSSIKPEERARLKAQMAAEVGRELKSSSAYADLLRRSAQDKAITWFSGILSNWGYDAEVTF